MFTNLPFPSFQAYLTKTELTFKDQGCPLSEVLFLRPGLVEYRLFSEYFRKVKKQYVSTQHSGAQTLWNCNARLTSSGHKLEDNYGSLSASLSLPPSLPF